MGSPPSRPLLALIKQAGFTHLTATTVEGLSEQHVAYLKGQQFTDQWDMRVSDRIEQELQERVR